MTVQRVKVWGAVLWVLLRSSAAIQVYEENTEGLVDITTMLPPTAPTTSEDLTQLVDNGMAVADIPIEPTATNFSPMYQQPMDEGEAVGKEVVDQQPHRILTTPSSIDYQLPPNHKNFTPSQYLGSIESPPIMNTFNKYQQQYKEYYAQKALYNQKPSKLEMSAHQNRLLTQGLGNYGDNSQTPQRPFPYQYEKGSFPSGYEVNAAETAQGEEEQVQHQMYFPEAQFEHSEPEQHSPHQHSLQSLQSNFQFPDVQQTSNQDHSHQGTFEGFRNEHHSMGEFGLQATPTNNRQKKGGQLWKKVMRMLSTLLPIGFIIASLTPSVLSINSTMEQKPSRLRSLDDMNLQPEDWKDPLVQLIHHYGLESLEDPRCEDRLFCEMSRMGKDEPSNFIQKGFWYLAHETPDEMADKVGMKLLFKAIRTGECEMFDCVPKNGTVTTENVQEDTKNKQRSGKIVKVEKKRKVKRKKVESVAEKKKVESAAEKTVKTTEKLPKE